MDDYHAILERHERKLQILERDVTALREIQKEIRSMNETLVAFAAELKHTNEHLANNERKIEEIDRQPRVRMQQVFTALVSALAGGIVTIIITFMR
ncbi:MAG: hypothetical protein ACI4QR_01535 [Eubacteriales bacterium]